MKGRNIIGHRFYVNLQGAQISSRYFKVSFQYGSMHLCIFSLLKTSPVTLSSVIRKLNIYIETELFYCSFRVTENISKFLSCVQRLPPRKRLNSSFFLFFGTVLRIRSHTIQLSFSLLSLFFSRRFVADFLHFLYSISLPYLIIQGLLTGDIQLAFKVEITNYKRKLKSS